MFDEDLCDIFQDCGYYSSDSENYCEQRVGSTDSNDSCQDQKTYSYKRRIPSQNGGLPRKRRCRPSRLIVPRILKRDIRNLYSQMFINVVNRMDCSLYKDFFDEFCRHDISLNYVMEPKLAQRVINVIPNTWREINIMSASVAAKYMHATSQIFPDMAMRLLDSKVVQQQYSEESRVEFKFEKKMTKFYDTCVTTNLWSETIFETGNYVMTDSTEDSPCTTDCEDSVNSGDGMHITFSSSSSSSSSSESEIDFNHNHDEQSQRTIHSDLHKNQSFFVPIGSQSESTNRKGIIRIRNGTQTQLMLETAPLLVNPIQIAIYGTIILHLDGDKKLTGVDYIYEKTFYRLKSGQPYLELSGSERIERK